MDKTLIILISLSSLLLSSCASPVRKTDEVARAKQTPENNVVELITLERTDFPRQLLSNGRLLAVARADLAFSSPGPLVTVNVSNGKYVNKGATLAKISRPDYELALESARINLEKARMDMYDFLIGQGYPSRDTLSVPAEILLAAKMKSGYASALNALARSRQDVAGTVLKAPFSGRVANISLRVHDQASTETFCTLVDDSSFDVDFTVMESEFAFLSKGLPVTVIPYADATDSYKGSITDINPIVDRNGQILVRARVKGAERLVDGMNVKVIVERVISDQLVVPRSAVVVRDNMDVLFTYKDDGRAHWVYVNIVASNGDSHSVIGNADRGSVLSEGDRVIVSGNLNLADGSIVTVKSF